MADVQNHIHLDSVIGGAPENAPTLTWRATDRALVPRFTVEIVEGLTGVRFDHATEDVVYSDFMYELFLKDGATTALAQLDLLMGLAGKRLYLVDHRHPDNGADHTDYIRTVRMTRMGEIQQEHLLLKQFRVQVYFVDLSPL